MYGHEQSGFSRLSFKQLDGKKGSGRYNHQYFCLSQSSQPPEKVLLGQFWSLAVKGDLQLQKKKLRDVQQRAKGTSFCN